MGNTCVLRGEKVNGSRKGYLSRSFAGSEARYVRLVQPVCRFGPTVKSGCYRKERRRHGWSLVAQRGKTV